MPLFDNEYFFIMLGDLKLPISLSTIATVTPLPPDITHSSGTFIVVPINLE